MDIDVGSLSTVTQLNNALSEIENYEIFRLLCAKTAFISGGIISFLDQTYGRLSPGEQVFRKLLQWLQTSTRVRNVEELVENIVKLTNAASVARRALDTENIPEAASNIAVFLQMNPRTINLIRLLEKEEVGVDLLSRFATLQKEAVKRLFSAFDDACRDGDEKELKKLFRLFPLVNEGDAGVTKFGAFLAHQMSAKVEAQLALLALSSQSPKPTAYVDIMTEFLENVAQVIQSNEQILSECFGPGSLFKLIRAVQQLCDEKAALIFLNFKEKRQLTVAVQRARQELTVGSRPVSTNATLVAAGQGSAHAVFEYCLSMEALVSEIVLLNARIELFLNFLRRRLLAGHSEEDADDLSRTAKIKQFFTDFEPVKISQQLVDAYLPQEQLFLRELVSKAILMDEVDQTTKVFSMVDEVFFVVQKCLSRAISSGNIDAVCAMLNYSASVLADQFINDVLTPRAQQCTTSGWIQQAYNLVHKRAGSGTLKTGLLGNGSSSEGHSSSSQTGKNSSNDSQVQYLFTLNSLEACLNCLQVLKTTLQHLAKEVFGLRPESDLSKLETCLSDLCESLERSFQQLLDNGFEQLRSVIRPQIATLTQPLASMKREIAEEELDQFALNDPWMESLIIGLQNLLNPFHTVLSQGNYERFVSVLADELLLRLERFIQQKTYTRFGALQLDKELRLLFNFFTSLSMFPCREKFARILQICKLLNLETVEEVSYYGNTSNWKLSANEIRRLLTLRVEFRTENIRRLQL
ncbi:hypothetical protein AAHC03_013495 [Spirometra sp. Aus1]